MDGRILIKFRAHLVDTTEEEKSFQFISFYTQKENVDVNNQYLFAIWSKMT